LPAFFPRGFQSQRYAAGLPHSVQRFREPREQMKPAGLPSIVIGVHGISGAPHRR